MLSMLFAIIFGLAIGYFATQNTAPVTIQLGELRFDNVPLYLVTLGSLVLGFFIAWLFYLGRTVSSTFSIYGKDHSLNRNEDTERLKQAHLEHRIRQLEAENARIKGNPAAAM